MKVVVFATEAFGGHGGIALYMRDFITALASHRHVNEVVGLPRLVREAPGGVPARVRWVTGAAAGKVAFVGAASRELARVGRASMVVCGHVNLLPVAYLASLRHRAPLALLIFGIDAWQPPPSRLAAALVARVDHVVSISETTLERFRGWATTPRADTHILPNAFDPHAFAPGPKPIALEDRYGLRGRTVLMTFGRMEASERYKGFDEMIALVSRLRAELPGRDIVYLAAGDGTDRARLVAKVRALAVGDHVVFTGRIPESEKADHYRLADVYVMPSYGEGFGFVLLEAMACGIPVVASRADGSREAVRDGMLGALVDPKSDDEIVAAIRRALVLPHGVVPEGLTHFEWPAFERRAHAFVDRATAIS